MVNRKGLVRFLLIPKQQGRTRVSSIVKKRVTLRMWGNWFERPTWYVSIIQDVLLGFSDTPESGSIGPVHRISYEGGEIQIQMGIT